MQPRERTNSAAASAAVEQLKASVGNLILPPSVGVRDQEAGGGFLKTGKFEKVKEPGDFWSIGNLLVPVQSTDLP